MKGHSAEIRQVRNLLGVLIAVVVADGLLSHFLITHGIGREANPFLQPFIDDTNFLFIKVAGALLSSLVMWGTYKKHPGITLTSILCFVALYTGILYWNLAVFFASQL